ncbi:hypothetical protein QNM99_14150 [Pseudomonas sp. PCH446]
MQANAHYIPKANQAGCPYQPTVLHFNTALGQTPTAPTSRCPGL